MENIFNLYATLNSSKYLEENVTKDLRNIKCSWKINEEIVEEETTVSENKQVIDNDNNEDFYSEVDKLLAKAQESIKQDYQTLNIKPGPSKKSFVTKETITKKPLKQIIQKPPSLPSRITSSKSKQQPVYVSAPYKTAKPSNFPKKNNQDLKKRSTSIDNIYPNNQQKTSINLFANAPYSKSNGAPQDTSDRQRAKTSQQDLSQPDLTLSNLNNQLNSLAINAPVTQNKMTRVQTVKLKDIAMEIFLPKNLENLINKNMQISQKILDARLRSKNKCAKKNSFLNKLSAYNSQDSQQSTEMIDNFSSIHRLEIIFKKSQLLLVQNFFQLNSSNTDYTKKQHVNKQYLILNFLKLKIVLSHFDNFGKNLKNLLNDFVNGFDVKSLQLNECNIFEIFQDMNPANINLLPLCYKSNKDLVKLASLRCSLIEIEFRSHMLQVLVDNFLEKILKDCQKSGAKKSWDDAERLNRVKLLHALFCLVTTKRVVIAV